VFLINDGLGAATKGWLSLSLHSETNYRPFLAGHRYAKDGSIAVYAAAGGRAIQCAGYVNQARERLHQTRKSTGLLELDRCSSFVDCSV
jgi:hypothetical protein